MGLLGIEEIDGDELVTRLSENPFCPRNRLIAAAFCSMYRKGVVADGLDFTIVSGMDLQGQQLLQQTIFARSVEGWSDKYLYDIEQQVMKAMNIEYVDGRVAFPSDEDED